MREMANQIFPDEAPAPVKFKDGFHASFPELGYRLALLGLKEKEIAEVFGVPESTFTCWKASHASFKQAVTEGKAPAVSLVVAALHKRALGFAHKKVITRVVQGEKQELEEETYYPPDPVACIFWLKNRQRMYWRDKVELGNTDKAGEDVAQPDLMEVARRLAFVFAKAVHKEA